MLKMSGARYTVLYVSQPYSLLENPSNLPLSRYLAEKTNTTAKSGLGKCDGECLVKSSLLEGAFVVSFLLLVTFCALAVYFPEILYSIITFTTTTNHVVAPLTCKILLCSL